MDNKMNAKAATKKMVLKLLARHSSRQELKSLNKWFTEILQT